MRQSGVIAAAGLYALEHNVAKLHDDHRRAAALLEYLRPLKLISVPKHIQSNMILLDVAALGLNANAFIEKLKEHGVWLSNAGETVVRIVLYNGITDDDIKKAANIIIDFENAHSLN